MSVSEQMRALLIAGLLTIAVAGCGGDDPLAPQVPGPPADVTVPDAGVSPSGEAAAGEDAGSTDGSADPSADETATPEADTGGTGDTGAAEPDASGGTTAPAEPQADDGPANDTAPPEGSNAQQFEDFCAQNPGAC